MENGIKVKLDMLISLDEKRQLKNGFVPSRILPFILFEAFVPPDEECRVLVEEALEIGDVENEDFVEMTATEIAIYVQERNGLKKQPKSNMIGRALTFYQFPSVMKRHYGQPQKVYAVKKKR